LVASRSAADEPRGVAPFDALRIYWRPLLVVALVLPVVIAAVVTSLAWFRAPFPGFFLMRNRVVPTVSGFDWPPHRERFFHAQVVAVDGTPVDSSAAVYAYVAARPVGTPVRYALLRDGRTTEETVASMRFTVGDYLETCGVLLLFGCAWLGFGVAIGLLQPYTAQARVYLLQGLLAGLYPITGIFLHRPDFPVLTAVYLVLECVFPATWIHLALVFPVTRRLTGARRLWPLAPYALSAVLAAAVLAGFYSQPPVLWPLHLTYLYAGASFCVFVGSLLFTYRAQRDARVRLRIKAVLPGAILAGTLALFALVESALQQRAFPVQFGLLLTPAFSACVAYAIAKHDLFDIDRIIRQSFVYALLSVVLTLLYAGAVELSSAVLPESETPRHTLVGALFVVLLAFVFEPLRRRLQRVVDRAFYRGGPDYRATVREVSEAMTTLLDLDEVVGRVTSVVTQDMFLTSASVCLLGEDDTVGEVWSRVSDGALHRAPAPACLAPLAAAVVRHDGPLDRAASLELTAQSPTAADVRAFLARLEAGILLPLSFRGRAIGLFVLGGKRSGQALGADDLDLLRTLANQTAIAVQNARSYRALSQLTRELDAKVQLQTGELRDSNQQLSQAYDQLKNTQAQLVQSEKMASLGRLVAGVAHELNNPASFIHGGLANLAEYVARVTDVLEAYERAPIADGGMARELAALRARVRLDYLLRETPELLRICAEGSERIKKIVDDLRLFVRSDQGERVPTNVCDDVDNTLRLLGDRIARGGVTVRKAYGPVPAVSAHAATLNQVWMNLLANALDAIEGVADPAIDLTIRTTSGVGSTGVEVVVRDNGGGVPPAVLSRIFEPFFTTKPIGKGTGLGLSIAYGAVKSHGGTIAVDSERGAGTCVTVCLPVDREMGPAPTPLQ
jgi:signal transduction histidine kinase